MVKQNVGSGETGITMYCTAAAPCTLTLIDAEVSYNTSSVSALGPELEYTDTTCMGSAAVKAGFWGQYRGVNLGYGATLTSEACDWGVGSEDNTTDVWSSFTGGTTGLGLDERVYCDSTGCI